jgi:hypothetical protein
MQFVFAPIWNQALYIAGNLLLMFPPAEATAWDSSSKPVLLVFFFGLA